MPITNLFPVKVLKECTSCHKKGKILINQIINNHIQTSVFCIKCFKREVPTYTLEIKCIKCPDCFKCKLQKIIYSSKEIKQFKKDWDSYLIGTIP